MHTELLRALDFWAKFNRKRANDARARGDLFLHFNAKADAYANCAAALRGESDALVRMAGHYRKEGFDQ